MPFKTLFFDFDSENHYYRSVATDLDTLYVDATKS